MDIIELCEKGDKLSVAESLAELHARAGHKLKDIVKFSKIGDISAVNTALAQYDNYKALIDCVRSLCAKQ